MKLLDKQTNLFNELFTEKTLTEVFYEYIRTHSAVGVDGESFTVFEKNLKINVDTIGRKINNETYRFTKYKTKLISKGANKFPRELSIPTIRDKIVIKQIHKFIVTTYEKVINVPRLHVIVSELFNEIKKNEYDYYFKADIKDFYPSINHKLLYIQLGKNIKDLRLLNLILKSLQRSTKSSKGVPQGLAISNVLANIYMLGFDKYFLRLPEVKLFRYVDDILILCKNCNKENIETLLKKKLRKIKLTPHAFGKNSKSTHGLIAQNEFIYLGYKFSGDLISVRESSISKILDSIINVFTQYRYSKDKEKSKSFIEWKINLRITGAISEKKKYGWLFFFSQINDMKLLFSLDHSVASFQKRFGTEHIKCKSFVRAFHEITKNLNQTNYIINYDKFNEENKRKMLTDIFMVKNVETIILKDVNILFQRKLNKSLHELELDLQPQS